MSHQLQYYSDLSDHAPLITTKPATPSKPIVVNAGPNAELDAWIVLARPEYDIPIHTGLRLFLWNIGECTVGRHVGWDRHYFVFELRGLETSLGGAHIAVPYNWGYLPSRKLRRHFEQTQAGLASIYHPAAGKFTTALRELCPFDAQLRPALVPSRRHMNVYDIRVTLRYAPFSLLTMARRTDDAMYRVFVSSKIRRRLQ